MRVSNVPAATVFCGCPVMVRSTSYARARRVLVASGVAGAANTVERVVAKPAFQHVVVAVAGQGVVEIRAAQIFDRDVDVAGGAPVLLAGLQERSAVTPDVAWE